MRAIALVSCDAAAAARDVAPGPPRLPELNSKHTTHIIQHITPKNSVLSGRLLPLVGVHRRQHARARRALVRVDQPLGRCGGCDAPGPRPRPPRRRRPLSQWQGSRVVVCAGLFSPARPLFRNPTPNVMVTRQSGASRVLHPSFAPHPTNETREQASRPNPIAGRHHTHVPIECVKSNACLLGACTRLFTNTSAAAARYRRPLPPPPPPPTPPPPPPLPKNASPIAPPIIVARPSAAHTLVSSLP